MSKKLKVAIVLIASILIIGLFFGVRMFYRFYRIQKIFSIVDSNVEKDNYYLETVLTYNDSKTSTIAYYKDGTGKLVAENGVYTWVDGTNAYMIDEENKKVYTLEIEGNSNIVSSDMFTSLYPGYSKNIFERMLMVGSASTSFKTETYDGEKCYKISIKDDTNNCRKTYWISKKGAKIKKATLEFPNGEIMEYVYDLKFNVSKLKHVELPDFTDYEFVDSSETDELETTETETIETEITEQIN